MGLAKIALCCLLSQGILNVVLLAKQADLQDDIDDYACDYQDLMRDIWNPQVDLLSLSRPLKPKNIDKPVEEDDLFEADLFSEPLVLAKADPFSKRLADGNDTDVAEINHLPGPVDSEQNRAALLEQSAMICQDDRLDKNWLDPLADQGDLAAEQDSVAPAVEPGSVFNLGDVLFCDKVRFKVGESCVFTEGEEVLFYKIANFLLQFPDYQERPLSSQQVLVLKETLLQRMGEDALAANDEIVTIIDGILRSYQRLLSLNGQPGKVDEQYLIQTFGFDMHQLTQHLRNWSSALRCYQMLNSAKNKSGEETGFAHWWDENADKLKRDLTFTQMGEGVACEEPLVSVN